MNEKFYTDQELIRNDDDQWNAYDSKENTVIIAGPGSGKTRVLTLKTIKLIQTEINAPSGIACISYSRETVRELKKRLKEYGYHYSKNDFIGTMHGFCITNILEPFGHLYPQYNIPVPLKVCSKSLSNSIYQGVIKELGVEPKQLSITDINKQRSISLNGSSEVKIQVNAFIVKAAGLYEQGLSDSGYVDFISMINKSTLMIREQAYVKRVLESKYPWLLIDEYQDLGKALHEIVLELGAQTEIKIFAVGDMNQSIYGFNGAFPDFLEELDSLDDFKSIHLSSNYRSNQDIIEGSLDTLNLKPPRLVYDAKQRTNENAEFTFITCPRERKAQYEVVAQKVIPKLIAKGILYKDIGILVGSNSFYTPEVNEMATALNRVDIPFFVAKWSFTNSDIVLWLQDCAQWCINDTSVSFDSLFRFWSTQLEIHNDVRYHWEIIRQKTLFYEILNTSREKVIVSEWLEFIFDKLELKKLLENSERYPEENENLDKLMDEALNKNLFNSNIKRLAFLGEPENEVTITTRHSVKGLEFEAIIMLGMEEGRFPDYRSKEGTREMEEEHRICYVSVSRAKRECIMLRSLIHTISYSKGSFEKKYVASRFWISLEARFGSTNNIYLEKDYEC
jgi:DNA helicase-2/ATP-dependent DNA helicase PcrA